MTVEEANYDVHNLSLKRDEASPYYLHKFLYCVGTLKNTKSISLEAWKRKKERRKTPRAHICENLHPIYSLCDVPIQRCSATFRKWKAKSTTNIWGPGHAFRQRLKIHLGPQHLSAKIVSWT